jgi:AcrR family transcriptional regulator
MLLGLVLTIVGASMGSSEPAQGPSKPLYRGLASGRGGMAPEQVARHQRARLIGAMIEAVSRHGYAGVTLRELVGLAGVSKSTFYEHFEDKQDCFLATFDEIVERAGAGIEEAFASTSGQRNRLRAALLAEAELAAQVQGAASLVVVDSLSLGSAGAERREAAAARVEAMLREGFAEGRGAGEVSELVLRGVAGGLRRIAYRALRAGHTELVAEQADLLLDWILAYQGDGGAPVGPALAPPSDTAPNDGGAEDEQAPGWEEPPSSPASRRALSQRERIVRAVARLAGERGFASLSVPAISGEAGVSNQTFYQEFAGKMEAFLAAFDALAEQALAQTVPAFRSQPEWPAAVAAALGALLSFLAANPLFARLAFFELPAAGPVGLERAEAASARFTAFLGPGGLPAGIEAPPEIVIEAIGGGIFAVIQHEITHGRAEALPRIGPELAGFVLLPYGVATRIELRNQ